jgi:hypothetical protein
LRSEEMTIESASVPPEVKKMFDAEVPSMEAIEDRSCSRRFPARIPSG